MLLVRFQFILFARCVKQLGFYTHIGKHRINSRFARCVKQLGFYTHTGGHSKGDGFARCVKQLGFYTISFSNDDMPCLLGVLNN